MLEEEIIPNGHKAIIFSQWSTIAKDLGIELSEYDPIVITGEVPPEQRQIQKNNGTLLHKKVVARKMGCKSVEEYNRRMARREKNLKEMEDNKDGK